MASRIKKDYRNKLVGSTQNVLFENDAQKENTFFGRDEYFNSVIVHSKDDLTGKIKKVKISSCNHNTLFGEIIGDLKKTEYAA